jgi:hypothetical protein
MVLAEPGATTPGLLGTFACGAGIKTSQRQTKASFAGMKMSGLERGAGRSALAEPVEGQTVTWPR